MALLRFVSGESSIKLDALHRICSVVATSPSLPMKLSPMVIEHLRVYMLDWDRLVRSTAFRCLRYSICPETEDIMVSLAIDSFTTYRLEASKSSLERVSIIRFVSVWVSLTDRDAVVELFINSILELILGQVGAQSGPLSPFLVSLIDLYMSIVTRHPLIGSRVGRIAEFFEVVFPALQGAQRDQLLQLVMHVSSRVSPVRLAESTITPGIMVYLLNSVTGIAILANSVDAATLSRSDDYLDCLLAALSQARTYEYILQLIDPFRLELADHILSVNKFKYMALIAGVDVESMRWKFPSWVTDRLSDTTLSGSRRSSLPPTAVDQSLISSKLASHAKITELNSVRYGSGSLSANVDRCSKLLHDYFLKDDGRLHSFVYMALVSLTCDLLASVKDPWQEDASLKDASLIAGLPGMDSDQIWLLSFRGDPDGLLRAKESGWMDHMWEHEWLRSIRLFSDIMDETLLEGCSLSPPTIQHGGDAVWSINGTSFNSAQMRRPAMHALRKYAMDSQHMLQILWTSPLSSWHECVLLDDPLVLSESTILIELIRDSAVTAVCVDPNDPVVRNALLDNIFIVDRCEIGEYQDPHSGVIFTVSSPSQGEGRALIAVFIPVCRSGSVSVDPMDWAQMHPASSIGATEAGCAYLKDRKADFLATAVESFRDDSHDGKQSAWFLGCLAAASQHGYNLCREIGCIEILSAIVTGSLCVSTDQTVICFHIADLIRRNVNKDAIDAPVLGVLASRRLSAEGVPGISPVLAVPESGSPTVAFTSSHEHILKEIDSLASSVHFKQKAASLATKRQKHPDWFLSVPLWQSVTERIRVGRFSLQARRVIHSLFIHTFYESEALEVLDRLTLG